MRPISVRWFDRLFLSGMVLELALRIADIREALNITNKRNIPISIAMYVGSFLIIGGFWFSISRLHSNSAKWAWTILLIAVPVAMMLTVANPDLTFRTYSNLERITFENIRPLLYISATIMLFRSDAKAWFANRG